MYIAAHRHQGKANMAVIPHLAFFLECLVSTLSVLWPAGSPQDQRDATRATLEGLEPRDIAEAMLAARMIAAHHASMAAFQRAALPDVSITDSIRLCNSAVAAGRSYDAALRLLDKRKAPPPTPRVIAPRQTAAEKRAALLMDTDLAITEQALADFTPEEIAAAEVEIDNDPIEMARAELAQRIPLHQSQDMTMEERLIAYARPSPLTPVQWAVKSARMAAAAREHRIPAAQSAGRPAGPLA